MAVYEHRYKRYAERLTPTWTRFLVLPKYAFKDVFKSRLLVFFYAATILPPVVLALLIYVRHNVAAIERLVRVGFDVSQFFDIDATFFDRFLGFQMGSAFMLALFIGPGLVSRDLANNGLPLYLSRPISRADYVLGKLTILLVLLSSITWIAGLLLFALNGNFEGWRWMVDNAYIAFGVFVTSAFWIGILSLLALALSAWVRWKVIAAFGMLAFWGVGAMLATMVNVLFKTQWGHLLNPLWLIEVVGEWLLRLDPPTSGPPPWLAALALCGIGGLCLLMLHRKIRAYQVVS